MMTTASSSKSKRPATYYGSINDNGFESHDGTSGRKQSDDEASSSPSNVNGGSWLVGMMRHGTPRRRLVALSAIFVAFLFVVVGCFGWYRTSSRKHEWMSSRGRGRGGDRNAPWRIRKNNNGASPETTPVIVPFEHVDRAQYGSVAAEDIVDLNLFDPSLRGGDDDNGAGKGRLLKVPFPTGAFWTNLVLQKETSDMGYSYPIMTYPYGYKWSPSTLQISYPPLRRLLDEISIRDIFNPDLAFSTAETPSKRHVTGWDPLSVTLRYYTTATEENTQEEQQQQRDTRSRSSEAKEDDDQKEKYWETYLVQGSPYITLTYQDVTPVITPVSIFQGMTCPPPLLGGGDENENGLCSNAEESSTTDGAAVPPETIALHGTRFLFHTRENLTWMVFASAPVTLSFDNIRKTTITFAGAYTGVLRLALVPPSQEPLTAYTSQFPDTFQGLDDLSTSTGVSRLACHANAYPVGGRVAWDFFKEKKKNKKDNDDATTTTAVVQFQYDVKEMDGSSSARNHRSSKRKRSRVFGGSSSSSSSSCDPAELLMLALPHHSQVLSSDNQMLLLSKDDFDLSYRSVKGALVPVVGDTWSYQEPLASVGFDSDSTLKNAYALDDVSRNVILEQVKKDMHVVLPTLDENVYGFGKQVARLAQLAHISSVLLADENDDEKDITSSREEGSDANEGHSLSLTEEIAQVLYKFLSAYLLGNNRDKLLFDTNFGGIISKDGLEFSGGDFGNGWYNDHLFHYGYVLYASAVLGRLNGTFVEEHGSAVDALLFDVAYSANADSSWQTRQDVAANHTYFFPFARHKSWYDSHSFASGLFPFADGKSMESSAESVNCYYGSYLWSLVRWGGLRHEGSRRQSQADSDMVDFARLLLAMEIRGVKTYWHMITPEDNGNGNDNGNVEGETPSDAATSVSEIYNPLFSKNLMVGNVGMMDVTVATWFGTNPLYVHMINFLPITAITRVLFEKRYVEEEFQKIIEPVYRTVEMAWRGYVICDRAMVDPNAAWKDALELRSYELDQAISQSQVLYFASTTDGFSLQPDTASRSNDNETTTNQENDAGGAQTQPSSSSSSTAFCSEHQACLELGLVGDCCPAPGGAYLDCCGHQVEQAAAAAAAPPQQVPQPTSSSGGGGGDTSKSLCSENKACADLGLIGNCCPSNGGAFLGCCDS